MLLVCIECFILDDLSDEGLDHLQQQFTVEFTLEYFRVVLKVYQTRVRVPLEGVGAFLGEELLELFLVLRRIQILICCHLESVPHDFSIETNVILLLVDNVCIGCGVVQGVFFGVRVVDLASRPCLDWHKVGTEDHLAESIVIHVLQTSSFLSRVDIGANRVIVDLFLHLLLDMDSRELLLVKPLLLLLVRQHLPFIYFKFKN